MNHKGFTLIELIVAIAVFSLVLGALTGFFLGAVKAQRKALASQELIDSVSYNLEYMSRTIRMAKKDIEGDCIEAKNNYQLTREEKGLKFLNYDNVCQEFFWHNDEKRLYESKNGGQALPLTPKGFKVTSFEFGSSGSWGQDQGQPKITLFLEAEGLKIQTTISQRNLNVIR